MARFVTVYSALLQMGLMAAVFPSASAPCAPHEEFLSSQVNDHRELVSDSTRKRVDTYNIVSQAPAGVPPVLSRLYEVRKNMEAVARELDRLKRRGLAPMGKAKDFDSLEGLYVAVLDPSAGMIALLRFQKEKFIDVVTGSEVQMTDHAGKKVIWIEVK